MKTSFVMLLTLALLSTCGPFLSGDVNGPPPAAQADSGVDFAAPGVVFGIILAAIAIAKEVYSLFEPIDGQVTLQNNSGKPLTVQVKTDLVEDGRGDAPPLMTGSMLVEVPMGISVVRFGGLQAMKGGIFYIAGSVDKSKQKSPAFKVE